MLIVLAHGQVGAESEISTIRHIDNDATLKAHHLGHLDYNLTLLHT